MFWQKPVKSTPSPRSARRSRPKVEFLEDRVVPVVIHHYFDQTTSVLALSGNVAGSPIMQQGPGSLSTEYVGEIFADYQAGANTLNFDVGSYSFALDSGNWAPLRDGAAGTAAANYGGQVTVLGLPVVAAVRDLIVLISTPAPVTLTPAGAGQFTFPSRQALQVYTGLASYNAPLIGGGSVDLADLAATNAAADGTFVTDDPDWWIITVPINLTVTRDIIPGVTATLNITGSIVGWAVKKAGPAPGGGDVGAALGFLDTLEADAPALVTAGATLDAAPVFQTAGAELAPALDAEVSPPAYSQTPHEAVVEQLFTDLFAADF